MYLFRARDGNPSRFTRSEIFCTFRILPLTTHRYFFRFTFRILKSFRHGARDGFRSSSPRLDQNHGLLTQSLRPGIFSGSLPQFLCEVSAHQMLCVSPYTRNTEILYLSISATCRVVFCHIGSTRAFHANSCGQ